MAGLPWAELEDDEDSLARRYASLDIEADGGQLSIGADEVRRVAVKYGAALVYAVSMSRHLMATATYPGIKARRCPTIDRSLWQPACRSTSAFPTHPGNEDQTKTRTDSFANTCPKEPASRSTRSRTSSASNEVSTDDPAKRSTIWCPWRNLPSLLR